MDTSPARNRKNPRRILLLDGPSGTELEARGAATPLPAWSAHALREAPDLLAEIHRDYAAAGATVHTTATFRTRPDTAGPDWAEQARSAVRLCRRAIPASHAVAGSIAPLADCYRPDLSPPTPGPAHQALAEVLADAGADLLLCETFPHKGEALIALDAAMRTGLPTWLSLTAGPMATLMRPAQLAEVAREAADRGAQAVLVNCVAASRTLPYVQALAAAVPDLRIGAYGNAGHVDERIGWRSGPPGPAQYASLARHWVDAGATIIGGCCGTGPAHIASLRAALSHGTIAP